MGEDICLSDSMLRNGNQLSKWFRGNLFISCLLNRFCRPTEVKASWPSTLQCSAGVSVCQSFFQWFTDTDLAEPILLVILYWIRAPGDPEEPSFPAAPSSMQGSQIDKDIHAWVRLLFSKNHKGFAGTKKEVKGPTPKEISLFSLYVCNNSQSC